jgi:hypothetical protein
MSDTPTELIEQNYHNLSLVVEELDLDHRLDGDDPSKTKGFLDHRRKADEDAEEMDENERLAWMFDQNAKAILLVAQELDIPERKLDGESVDLGKFIENTGFTVDPRKTETSKAETSEAFTLDPRGDD